MEQSNRPTSEAPSTLSALEKLCVIWVPVCPWIPDKPPWGRVNTAGQGWSLRSCTAHNCTTVACILPTLAILWKPGRPVMGNKSLFLRQWYYHYVLLNEKRTIEFSKILLVCRILVILRSHSFVNYLLSSSFYCKVRFDGSQPASMQATKCCHRADHGKLIF